MRSFFVGILLFSALSLMVLLPFLVAAQDVQPLDFSGRSDPGPSFSLISPLSKDVIQGSLVAIIRPRDPGVVTSATLSSDVLSISLDFDPSTWSVAWDSTSVGDGSYPFSVQVCAGDRCESRDVVVEVRNEGNDSLSRLRESVHRDSSSAVGSPVTSSAPPPLFSILPSDVPSAFYLGSGGSFNGWRSSGDPIRVESGFYSGELVPLRGLVTRISSSRFSVNGSGTFASFSPIDIPTDIRVGDEWFVPFDGLKVTFGFISSEESVLLSYPSGSQLLGCTSWDAVLRSCNVTWSRVPIDGSHFVWSGSSPSVVFVWVYPGEQVDRVQYPAPSFSVTPSTISGSFLFHSYVSGEELASDGLPISIPRSLYEVQGALSGFPLDVVRFQRVVINHDGVLLSHVPFERDALVGGPDEPSLVLRLYSDFSFRSAGFSVAPDFSDRVLVSCENWDAARPFSCDGGWSRLLYPRLSSDRDLVIGFLPDAEVTVSPVVDVNSLVSGAGDIDYLLETIQWLRWLHSDESALSFGGTLVRYPALANYTDLSISLECDSSSRSPRIDTNGFSDSLFFTNQWERGLGLMSSPPLRLGDTVSCDGVSLTNRFTEHHTPADTSKTIYLGHVSSVKQGLMVSNRLDSNVSRLIGVRFTLPASAVVVSSGAIIPTDVYQVVHPTPLVAETTPSLDSVDFSEGVPSLDPLVSTTWKDAVLRFYDVDGQRMGRYSLVDFLDAGYDPRVIVHAQGGETVVETILQVPLSAGESLDLDPTYELSDTANFSSRWNGGAASDRIGTTVSTSGAYSVSFDPSAVKVVNVDNNAYANDLLISAPLADVNSKTDAGAVYLIKDADTKAGVFDLINTGSFDAMWNGGASNHSLGRVDGGYTAQVVDLDGNGYTNDLLISGAFVDVPAANAGAVYMILDVDKVSGKKDLNNATFYDARWTGHFATDELGFTSTSGPGVEIVDIDNDGVKNDLILVCSLCNTMGRTDNGGVVIVLDANVYRGNFDINGSSNSYFAFYAGSRASDTLGALATSDRGVYLVDIDNNGYTNDLIIGASLADVGLSNNGAVYLIKDVDTRTGFFDLNVAATFDVSWTGPNASDGLGNTTNSGHGVIVANLDGNAYANDLILSAPLGDAGGSNRGAVYMILDIDTRMGISSLSRTQNYNARWVGGTNTDEIGLTNGGGQGVQVVNLDGNSIANDLVVTSYLHNAGRTDNGAVYIMRDVNNFVGNFTLLTTTSNYTYLFQGSQASDFLGDLNFTNDSNSVQFVNLDGNASANDLIIAGVRVNSAKADTGAVYLIRDVNKLAPGNYDLNNAANYSARWAESNTNDFLGRSGDSGAGYKVRDLDNNGIANDLILLAPFADVAGRSDNGAVTIIKDFSRKSGTFDLNTAGSYDVRFYGGANLTRLGDTNISGEGVRLVNLDNNAYTNDLVFITPLSDGPFADAGSFAIILDVDQLPSGSILDMNAESSYYRKYWGGAFGDKLGITLQSGEGAQIVDLDNNGYTNDILVRTILADVNSKTDAGAVYLLKDVVAAAQVGSDYSFVLSLPLSGCTTGKGNISGGSACERAWIESTDLSGVSDANQIEPEGQSAGSAIPFFAFDNQSTSSSDFNIYLDLNQAYSSYYVLKASTSTSGYQGQCLGVPAGCITLTTSFVNVGRASYSTGGADLNVYFWGDFVSAPVAQEDRNVDSNAVAS